MIEYYILWIVSFISLYLAIFWLNILYLDGASNEDREIEEFPTIDIVVPMFNEEKTIAETINSLLDLDYPKNKLRIIVVNDGSTDNGVNVVKTFKDKRLLLIDKKNEGKAKSVNLALNKSKSELFSVVDADSRVDRDSLKKMLCHFNDKEVGAVISLIKSDNPKNFVERLQWFQYLFASFIRKLMASIDTLSITPGVLSVYRTDLIRKLGGFDNGNLTEDFEIALKLKYNHYKVKIELNSYTYTNVPDNLRSLLKQRVRWYRGFIYNILKYKKMLFNRKYGMMGMFQMPLNLISPLLLMVSCTIVLSVIFQRLYKYLINFILVGLDALKIYNIPTLYDVIFGLNVKMLLPSLILFVLGIYILFMAHKYAKEKWRYHLTTPFYLFIFPYLIFLYWVIAIFKELVGAKKIW